MIPHVLVRLDTKEIPNDLKEIRAFSTFHNERARIPYFLEYHRKLGVDRFFIIDHKSEDGTQEYLLSQPDCHVYHTKNSFSEAHSGIAWNNTLLHAHGLNHWCVSLDADELLVYPNCETVKLRDFCDFLDTEGAETFFTFLLDMYPDNGIENAIYTPGQPFLDFSPYFDRDYKFVDRIHLTKKIPFPKIEAIGGPRSRCFFGDQGINSPKRRLFNHLVERTSYKLNRMGFPVPFIRLKATPLFKIPLIKMKPGYAYISATHELNQKIRMSSVRGALLHFKFFSDFHARAISAVKSGEHAQGSAEYKQYLKHMDKVGNLMYEGSTKYQSSHDLLDHKLIETSPAYKEFLSKK